MRRVVAVTGANGFVGRHIVTKLLDEGWLVRGITRSPASLPHGVEPHAVGYLGSEETLRALEGCAALVHAAGRAHRAARGSPGQDAFRDVNVTATSALLDAALRAKVGAVVLVSSVAAVAGASEARLTPDTPPRPDTPYGRSKLESEEVVRAKCRAAGVPAVILRPPMIYGPGMPGNPARIFRLVWRGVPLPLGALTQRRSVVGIQNFVAAVAIVLNQPTIAMGAHFVADREEVSTAEFARRCGAALGRPARLIAVSPGALRGLARAIAPALRLLGREAVAEAIARVTGGLTVDTRSLTSATGFTPPLSLDAGLALAAVDFRASHGSRR